MCCSPWGRKQLDTTERLNDKAAVKITTPHALTKLRVQGPPESWSDSSHLVSHAGAALTASPAYGMDRRLQKSLPHVHIHTASPASLQPQAPPHPRHLGRDPLLIPRTSHHSSFLLREAGPSPRLGALTPRASQFSGPPLAGQGHWGPTSPALHLGPGVRSFCSLGAGAKALLSRTPHPHGRLLLATGNVSIS